MSQAFQEHFNPKYTSSPRRGKKKKEKERKRKIPIHKAITTLSSFKDKLNTKKNTPHFTDSDISCRKMKFKEEL